MLELALWGVKELILGFYCMSLAQFPVKEIFNLPGRMR
jgi:hypothetical protein